MSRKHFQMIADDIKCNYEHASHEGKLALTELVDDLCNTFIIENGAFNGDKFRRACGLEI